MTSVLGIGFLAVLIQGDHNGRVLNGEEDRPVAGRAVVMLMPAPARYDKEVAFLPLKTHAVDDGCSLALVRVINGAVDLSMRPGFDAGSQHLYPAGHSLHHGTASMWIGELQRDIVKGAGIHFSEIGQRPLGIAPLIRRYRRIRLLARLPGRSHQSSAVLQIFAILQLGYRLLLMRVWLKEARVKEIVDRNVKAVHPDRTFVGIAAMIVPAPGRVEHEIARFEIDLIALNRAIAAAPIDNPAHSLSGMTMAGGHFTPIQPLHRSPEGWRDKRLRSEPRICQRDGPPVAATLNRDKMPGAFGDGIQFVPLPEPGFRLRRGLPWHNIALKPPERH